jgi:hypothetical protein
MNRLKPRTFNDSVSLAGWLFADLFLGLFVLFLITMPGIKNLDELLLNSTATATSTFTLTPTLTTTPKPAIRKLTTTPIPFTLTPTPLVGLDMTPAIVVVKVNASAALDNSEEELNSLKSAILDKFADYQNKRAGLVIVLGYHNDVSNGMALARLGIRILKEAYPQVFGQVVSKPFWYSLDSNHPSGTISFEVYFYNR